MLEEQLGLLARRGHVGLTYSEWERRHSAGTLPERTVVVTFDDGYSSTLLARSIMDRLSYPGTVFPVLSFLESGETLCWPGVDQWRDGSHSDELRPLRWQDLERLVEAGWEVGSHTVSHPRLTTLSGSDLAAELGRSREALARRLGRCETIAYPYGDADERVAQATAAAGYLAGCTLARFQLVDLPYLRPRIGLFESDRGPRLKLKLSRAAQAVRRSRVAARLIGGDS